MKVVVATDRCIKMAPELLAKLEGWCADAGGKEISGVGTILVDGNDLIVTEAWLLAAGSESFTQIDPETLTKLMQTGVDPSTIKLWWHRHPVGNGVAGPHNWSSIDEDTCVREPMGSSPQMVGWSVAIVRTPHGWVGRVDHHHKSITVHLPVDQPMTLDDHKSVYSKMLALRGPVTYDMMSGTARDTTWITNWENEQENPEQPEVVSARQLPLFSSSTHGRSLKRVLKRRKMSRGTFSQAALLLQHGMLPEDVADVHSISLTDMVAVGLINRMDLNEANARGRWLTENQKRIMSGTVRYMEIPEKLRDKVIQMLGDTP